MCIEDGCQSPVYVAARGLCRKHWRAHKNAGTLGPLLTPSGRPAGGTCAEADCERTDLQGDGLCRLHYKRKYRAANKDRLNAQARALAAANPARHAESLRKHAEQHPTANAASTQRARARERGVEMCDIAERDLDRLYASPCMHCGSNERVQADHIIPTSRGGRHSIGNLAPVCSACNKAKAARTIMEWRMHAA